MCRCCRAVHDIGSASLQAALRSLGTAEGPERMSGRARGNGHRHRDRRFSRQAGCAKDGGETSREAV